MQHVFLPTAFFTWFDRESHGFYISLTSYENVVSEVTDYTKDFDLNLVNSMNTSYLFINNLWLFEEASLNAGLKSFCEKFNSEWDKNK